MRRARAGGLAAVTAWAAVVAAGCAHTPRPPPSPAAAPTETPTWRTLRAEHQVQVTVTLEGGKREERRLRGVVAVERPDRFRLRALGPAGITLFDLLSIGGQVKVIEAIRDPSKGALGELVSALAGDLQAAFQLAPAAAGRRVSIERGATRVDEPGRRVRLSGFTWIGGHAVPTRIEVLNDARRYAVEVQASGITLDEALDPRLFSE